jgi:hypothetical protein
VVQAAGVLQAPAAGGCFGSIARPAAQRLDTLSAPSLRSGNLGEPRDHRVDQLALAIVHLSEGHRVDVLSPRIVGLERLERLERLE